MHRFSQPPRQTQARRSHSTARWKRILAGTLSGTLLYAPTLLLSVQAGATPSFRLAQARRSQPLTLGVVRNSDNAAQWDQVTARLQAAELPYQVIELQQVQQASDLEGFTVVFLPNVQTITSAQLLAIESWMNRGGRLIVSGPAGSSSSYGVQQALRSLLGAYWGFQLEQPAALEPTSDASQAWVNEAETSSQVLGAAVIPNGLSSQTVATWKNVAGNGWFEPSETGSRDTVPAVVITERTTFLGWHWGDTGSSVTLDSTWLRAALGRHGDVTSMSEAASPSPSASQSSQASFSAESSRTVTPVPVAPGLPASRPVPPSADPAEQVAPAGVPVEMSSLPITTLEAIAMRQELENLIGRFESALLSANSANSSISLRGVESAEDNNPDANEVLTASADSTIPTEVASRSANGTVQEAQQISEEFPQLVAARDYATARQQWLRAREILWQNFPTDRPLAQPEIRAMWLDRGTIVRAGSRRGLEQIFDRLAAAGINTVFFETVNAGYPIYPSDVAPQQNPLTRHWDPLAEAVDLAHERDIELHAWVWAFAAGNRPHNTLVNLPADYPGPVISAHPDWANYDNRGNMFPPGQGKPFLDPANPAVRRYLLRLFDEIVTRYDVDGLQLDYIRYPFQDPSAGRSYGYGIAARQQFQRLTGVDPVEISPSDRQLWQQWTDFRTDQINSFVAETARQMRQRNPDLILSAAVFSMSEHERIQKIQQNWEVWARRGDVDLIVPMSYAMDTNRLQRLAGPWLESDAELGSILVLPGIRLLNLPEPAALDQIQALRDLPAGGYSLFAVENLNESLQGIFSRTQSEPAAPIPYRQPFAAAVTRYNALQREWSYLLENEQLWMRDQQLEEWRTQAEALELALNELADQPSRQKLERARAQLNSFRSNFNRWMYLQSLNHSYRVSTWENRLEVLDTLLNYGERVVIEQRNSSAQATSTP
ncbi:MAG: family 10 glycosylhydrolase [Leptolyngbyaceae cyanobacterium RM1_406_9]|nr:family 10 glycosylhydrolase [Leptolyngbyaceae cyanobacterium RM1_406_9]